jgi:low affinity Fe/Cu permease
VDPEAARKTRSAAECFGQFAAQTSSLLGSRWAFTCAVLIILIWAAAGPLYHFSDTWQLVINTGTTIITFLMVFLIQNTQNRDARAINLKLNELIHAIDKAKNRMIDIENLSDEELNELAATYESIRLKSRAREVRKLEQREAINGSHAHNGLSIKP